MTDRMRMLLCAAQTGDSTAEETLVEENERLIWAIVQRYIGRGVEKDDLFQLGCMGFVKAVQNFDVAYGTEFSTYAVPKISGEIRRFLRDDGAIKVGRTQKQQAWQISRAKEQLRATLGREPVLTELSELTGLTPEEIAAAEVSAEAPQSLQQETGDGLTLESALASSDGEEKWIQRLEVRQAVESLPEKEKKVIALRYYRACTQQECAGIIHVSQVQVSRLEKKALGRLKELIMA